MHALDMINSVLDIKGRNLYGVWLQTGVYTHVSMTTAVIATMVSDVRGHCLAGGW